MLSVLSWGREAEYWEAAEKWGERNTDDSSRREANESYELETCGYHGLLFSERLEIINI